MNIACIKNLTGARILHCHPGWQPYGCSFKIHDDVPLIPVDDRIVHAYWHPESCRWTYYTEKQATLVENDLLAVFIEKGEEQG